MQNKKKGVLKDKYFIYRAGYEYITMTDEVLLKEVHLYPTFQEYVEHMKIHIWDFTVRYLQRPLRLSVREMEGFNEFLTQFVQPLTKF